MHDQRRRQHAGLAVNLSVFLGRTVIDRTGFNDTFDYELTWAPEFSTKAPVPVLVINHVEKPTRD